MRRIKYFMLTCVTVGCMALTGGCQGARGEGVAKEKSEESVITEASRDEKGIGKEEIVIVDQLGKEIVLDGVPERVATTIMPFPYIYYAVVGNSDHLIACNPSSLLAYEDSALKYMYPELALSLIHI